MSVQPPQQKSFPVSIGVIQPSSVEELPETEVKAWKRRFLTELRTCQPLLIIFFFFLSCDVCLEVKLYYYFIKMEQSTGHVQVKNIYCICFCGAYVFVWPMSVFTSSHSYDVELVKLVSLWLIN